MRWNASTVPSSTTHAPVPLFCLDLSLCGMCAGESVSCACPRATGAQHCCDPFSNRLNKHVCRIHAKSPTSPSFSFLPQALEQDVSLRRISSPTNHALPPDGIETVQSLRGKQSFHFHLKYKCALAMRRRHHSPRCSFRLSQTARNI